MKSKENLTYRLLKQKFNDYPRNRKKLDFLCWTHPDNDHTLGLDDIITKKAVITVQGIGQVGLRRILKYLENKS